MRPVVTKEFPDPEERLAVHLSCKSVLDYSRNLQ